MTMNEGMMQPILTVAEVNGYIEEVFPEVQGQYLCEHIAPMEARVRAVVGPQNLRPGGTVSGPTMFGLADCGFYMVLLAMIGKQALAVTTNASIDFMRKPEPCDMIAEARILKLGRVLAVGDVLMYSEGSDKPVARASMTYSIPPAR